MADNLTIIHDATSEALVGTDFDWGSIFPQSSEDKFFRVKNNSVFYTAVNVVVSLEDVGGVAVPSVSAQHLLSVDDVVFSATLSLGDIPPTAISPVITLRRSTASDADSGTWSFRVKINMDSWT